MDQSKKNIIEDEMDLYSTSEGDEVTTRMVCERSSMIEIHAFKVELILPSEFDIRT